MAESKAKSKLSKAQQAEAEAEQAVTPALKPIVTMTPAQRLADLKLLKEALDQEIQLVGGDTQVDPADFRIEPFTKTDVTTTVPRAKGHWSMRFSTPVILHILNTLANCGVVYRAVCEKGVSYRQWHRLCKDFKGLGELQQEALELYREKISMIVHNRATDGWKEPVFYKGCLVGQIRKFSDRMLEMHAKRHVPEYRDRANLDVNVTGGVLVVHSGDIDKDKWLEEQRKRKSIDSQIVEGDPQ